MRRLALQVYHVEMDEQTSFVPLYFMPTIRLCEGCSIELVVSSHVGLTISSCSLTFTDTTTRNLSLRAVPTPGANTRIVALEFTTVVADDDSIWQGYSLADIRVSLLALRWYQ